MEGQVEVVVWKRLRISAAHFIPGHPGKCKHLHGHNYTIEVGVEGVVDSTGMVKDFYDVKKDLVEVIERPCDHRNLNEVYPHIITTAEVLAMVWLRQLRERDSRYRYIRVYETDDSWVELDGRLLCLTR